MTALGAGLAGVGGINELDRHAAQLGFVHDEAAQLIAAALNVERSSAAAYSNYGLALSTLGRHAEALASKLPVHIIEGAGHLPHMEKAGEVNRLIAAFIAAK